MSSKGEHKILATAQVELDEDVKPPGYGPVVSRVSGTGGLMFRA